MGLADYQPVRETVAISGGQSMQVRGLALEDVTVLFRAHLADLDKVVAIFGKQLDADQAVTAMMTHAIALVKEAPGLVANLIALASDEPDAVDNARRLPFAVQVTALKAVARLTFDEAGGPKKFVEGLGDLLRGLAPPQQ